MSLRVRAVVRVYLRPSAGALALADLPAASFRHVQDGSPVVLQVSGLHDWEAGVPEYLGRVLTDAGAVTVQVEGTGRGLNEFARTIERAAADYEAAR